MNSLRKVLGFLLAAVTLAAFALPSVAGDNGKKVYKLDVELASPQPAATPPFTLTAKFTNASPTGNSSFKSFSLSVSGLTIVGVDQPATGTATFTASSVSVVNTFPVKPGDSFTVTLRVSSCGDGAWSAVLWTGTPFSGQNFALVPDGSNLATPVSCGNLPSGAEFAVPDSINPGCVTGDRGYYDKDGSVPSGTLPYFVTNTIPTNDQLHFRWPDFETGGDPLATFDYTVCAPGPLPEVPNTQVAWLNTNGNPASTPGTPAYITAQDCLAPKILPAPYGTLVSDNGGTITVNALSPVGAHGSIAHSFPPFDIVIGTERMTVTGVSSDDGPGGDLSDSGDFSEGESEQETWTVTRHVGGTIQVPHAGGLVMSTPLPLLPASVGFPYTAGNQALMCVADRFAEGGGHATTFIDIGGDGWSEP